MRAVNLPFLYSVEATPPGLGWLQDPGFVVLVATQPCSALALGLAWGFSLRFGRGLH